MQTVTKPVQREASLQEDGQGADERKWEGGGGLLADKTTGTTADGPRGNGVLLHRSLVHGASTVSQ